MSLCLVSIKADFSCNAAEESVVHISSPLETQLYSSGTGNVTNRDRGQSGSELIETGMCSISVESESSRGRDLKYVQEPEPGPGQKIGFYACLLLLIRFSEMFSSAVGDLFAYIKIELSRATPGTSASIL